MSHAAHKDNTSVLQTPLSMLLPSCSVDMATNSNKNNNRTLKKPSSLSLGEKSTMDVANESPLGGLNPLARQRMPISATLESSPKLEDEAVGRFPQTAQIKKKKVLTDVSYSTSFSIRSSDSKSTGFFFGGSL